MQNFYRLAESLFSFISVAISLHNTKIIRKRRESFGSSQVQGEVRSVVRLQKVTFRGDRSPIAAQTGAVKIVIVRSCGRRNNGRNATNNGYIGIIFRVAVLRVALRCVDRQVLCVLRVNWAQSACVKRAFVRKAVH